MDWPKLERGADWATEWSRKGNAPLPIRARGPDKPESKSESVPVPCDGCGEPSSKLRWCFANSDYMALCPECRGDTTFIYAHINPLTGCTFYIGQSTDPEGRLVQHIHGGDDRNPHWRKAYKEILQGDAQVQLVILEECGSHNAYERENWWIAKAFVRGEPLVNQRIPNPFLSED